jgi:Cu/Ag efflux protein CusF
MSAWGLAPAIATVCALSMSDRPAAASAACVPSTSHGSAGITIDREGLGEGLHDGAKAYRATGVIRSFGRDRAWLNIAHDAIPGYMGAMTMSFWPQRKEQLDGLMVGDVVEFEFTETEDARRLLSSIRKRP